MFVLRKFCVFVHFFLSCVKLSVNNSLKTLTCFPLNLTKQDSQKLSISILFLITFNKQKGGSVTFVLINASISVSIQNKRNPSGGLGFSISYSLKITRTFINMWVCDLPLNNIQCSSSNLFN